MATIAVAHPQVGYAFREKLHALQGAARKLGRTRRGAALLLRRRGRGVVLLRLPRKETPLAVLLAPDGEVVDVVHRLRTGLLVNHVNMHAALHEYDAGCGRDEGALFVIEFLVTAAAGRDALDLRGLGVVLPAGVSVA